MITEENVGKKIDEYRFFSKFKQENVYYHIMRIPESCPMYLNSYLDEKARSVNRFVIFIDRAYLGNEYFEYSLCHELGHLEAVMERIKSHKKVTEPKFIWEHIWSELRADSNVYYIMHIRRWKKTHVCRWLWVKIVRNFNRVREKGNPDRLTALADIVLNASRLIFCFVKA